MFVWVDFQMRDTSDITFNYKSLIDIENEVRYRFK